MDPDKALKDVREAAKTLRETISTLDWEPESATDLIDSFEALDQWLSSGGYLPQVWSEAGRS